MKALAKAEALIYSAAYDIFYNELSFQLPDHIYQAIYKYYPFSKAEIRDRLEWYIIDFGLSLSFYDLEGYENHSTSDLLAALLDYETENGCLCPCLLDLKPKPNPSFDPEILPFLPDYIEKD